MHFPILVIAGLLACASVVDGNWNSTSRLRVATWNIAATSPHQPWWSKICLVFPASCKKFHVIKIIKEIVLTAREDAIIGLQGIYSHQLMDIKTNLDNSKCWASAESLLANEKTEISNPILYRHDRLRILSKSTHWLRGESSNSITIAVFQHRENQGIFVIANTQLDDADDPEVRAKEIDIALQHIKSVREYPSHGVILMGSLNEGPTGVAFTRLREVEGMEDVWDTAPYRSFAPYSHFDVENQNVERSDSIWLDKKAAKYLKPLDVNARVNMVDGAIVGINRPLVADFEVKFRARA